MESTPKATERPTSQEFLAARKEQKSCRGRFSEIARGLPRYAQVQRRFAHAPLICHDSWIPKTPIALGTPDTRLEDDTRQLITTFAESGAAEALNASESPWYADQALRLLPQPVETGGSFGCLIEAIRSIEKPPWTEKGSRPSYSLASIDSSNGLRLTFREAGYFDYINCGELLAYELVLQWCRLKQQGLPILDDLASLLDERLLLRARAGDWTDVGQRPSIAGVNMLTIFVDRRRATASFPMMARLSNLGSAMGALHVIPAGEFQPTTEGAPAFKAHCTLWQTILREFAEEILLDAEAKSHGLDMLQLADRPTIRPMLELIRGGHWKAHFLGLALDPLTLKPEIMIVSCIDKAHFHNAFGGLLKDHELPIENDEGRLLRGPAGWGELLSKSKLEGYRDDVKTLPAGRGCIELFLEHSEQLLEEHGVRSVDRHG